MVSIEIFNLQKRERKILEQLRLSVNNYLITSTKTTKILKYAKGNIYIAIKDIGLYINFIMKYNVLNLRSIEHNNYNILFKKKFKGGRIYVFSNNNVQSIALLTSGGDAPGMNAAIRSIYKLGNILGTAIYGIYNGYEGMINNNIELLTDRDQIYINKGGTYLKSARSNGFRKEEGRIRALFNLMVRGINNLILLGGDGSLRGMKYFIDESQKNIHFIKKMIAEGRGPDFLMKRISVLTKIEIENLSSYDKVRGVFIPATIDNDLPLTSMTIGTDSAMHRVVDAVENLTVTMASHNRAFIVEVMGRNCGFLGLMASFALNADFLFIPEHPLEEKELYEKLKSNKKKTLFIILAEGAILFKNGEKMKLTPDFIKNILHPEIDTRILTLGHLQRGGRPSAFDRYLGTMSGIKAIFSIIKQKKNNPAILFSNLDFNNFKKNPLETFKGFIDSATGGECFSYRNHLRTISIDALVSIIDFRDELLASNNFNRLLRTRGCYFERALDLIENRKNKKYIKNKVAVVLEGQRAAGMNICLSSIVDGCEKKILLINNGFDGLLQNEISIDNVEEIKSAPFKFRHNIFEQILLKLKELSIDTLIILGSSKVLRLCNYLKSQKISVIIVPFSISNNIPYGGHSIGCDTALNSIMQVADTLLTNGKSLNRSVDIIEVGGHTGYLASQSALICGATGLLIPEFHYNNKTLYRLSRCIHKSFEGTNIQNSQLIVRSKKSLNHISSESLRLLIQSNIHDINIDYSVLGRLERGDTVSPFDRVKGTLLGALIIELLSESKGIRGGVMGIRGDMIIFTDIRKVLKKENRRNRKIDLFSLITSYLK